MGIAAPARRCRDCRASSGVAFAFCLFHGRLVASCESDDALSERVSDTLTRFASPELSRSSPSPARRRAFVHCGSPCATQLSEGLVSVATDDRNGSATDDQAGELMAPVRCPACLAQTLCQWRCGSAHSDLTELACRQTDPQGQLRFLLQWTRGDALVFSAVV